MSSPRLNDLFPGFLLAEEAALKRRLEGMTVRDARKASRRVDVFFAWPSGETTKSYPFLTIDLTGIRHARDRQHSDQLLYAWTDGQIPGAPTGDHPGRFTYLPSTSTDPLADLPEGTEVVSSVEFVPVDLTYQIAVHTRSVQHNRQLVGELLGTGRIPFRYGELMIPEDGTVRRLDNLTTSPANLHDTEANNDKIVYRTIFMVQLNSELRPFDLRTLLRVRRVVLDVDIDMTLQLAP